MAQMVALAKRERRPEGLNYRETLEKRFQVSSRPALCAMDYLNTSTSQQRKPYDVMNRTALIDICGVLCNDPMWWDETGYDELRNEVQTAAEDTDVDSIMLLVNSPGGETDNAFETADIFKAAAKLKTMWGVASPTAYSAAYLLLSQCETIYVPQITGGVGSIGVYMMHMDLSGYLANLGIKPTFISAGTGKTDGNPYEPLSKEALAKYKAEVDRLYGEFVNRVASSRSLSESSIIKFGAALFEGSKAAIGSGLADRAGSPDVALPELAARATAKQVSSANAQFNGGTSMENPNPSPTPAAAPPPAAATVDVAKVTADAKAEGYSEAAEVFELCSIGNVDMKRAAAFVSAKTPLAEVRKALLKERADASANGGELRGGVLPHEAAQTDKPSKSLKERNVEKGRAEGWLKT